MTDDRDFCVESDSSSHHRSQSSCVIKNMHRHFQSIALLLVTSTLVGSFALNSVPHRLSQSSRLRGTDDQIINDLNLEEMFEVFEAAGLLTCMNI